MLPTDPLSRAWLALIALSAGSTAVAALVAMDLHRAAAGAAILLLAWLKSRVILSRYLGLAQAPGWRRGFNLVQGLFCLLLLTLFLIPAMFA